MKQKKGKCAYCHKDYIVQCSTCEYTLKEWLETFEKKDHNILIGRPEYAIGYYASKLDSSGFKNTAIGYEAGTANGYIGD